MMQGGIALGKPQGRKLRHNNKKSYQMTYAFITASVTAITALLDSHPNAIRPVVGMVLIAIIALKETNT